MKAGGRTRDSFKLRFVIDGTENLNSALRELVNCIHTRNNSVIVRWSVFYSSL